MTIRRVAATLAVVTAVLAGTAAPAAAVAPDPKVNGATPVLAAVGRVAGADRFATAVELSKRAHGPGEDTVVVASGESFADALAGAPVAAAAAGPLLLTRRDAVPPVTLDELRRLTPKRILLLGGTGVASAAVAAELGAVAPVTRLAGADRYATAVEVAKAGFPTGAATAYVASGESWTDALLAGAAAARVKAPLLLVARSSTPAATAAELARLRATQVLAVGDLDGAVVAAPGAMRIAGVDPIGTAVALTAGLTSPPADVLVASSANFPDALAAAAAGRPLLLVPGTCVPDAVREELERLAPAGITLVGGTAAVSAAVEKGTTCGLPDHVTFELGASLTAAQRGQVRGAVDAARRHLGDAGPIVVQAYEGLDEMIPANARHSGWSQDFWRRAWGTGGSGKGNKGWFSILVGWATPRFTTSSVFQQLVVHEYAHSLEYHRGGFSSGQREVPQWITEGGAEWLAAKVAILEGWSPAAVATAERASVLRRAKLAPLPLWGYEEPTADDQGEYTLGRMGVERMVELGGEDVVLRLFELAGGRVPWGEAFQRVTGMSPDAFYETFPGWLASR